MTTTRNTFSARPHMVTREDMYEDWWLRKAVMRASDLPPEPEGECEGWGNCTERHPCDFCDAFMDWESGICAIVGEATGWPLYEYNTNSAYSPTGRPFADAPWARTRRNRAGTKAIVVLRWHGGLDI